MLYLGPYQWRSSADFVAWMPPVGANPVVDLRGLPMQAAAGGRPNGFGIFAGPAGLDAAYLPLGKTADDLLTTSLRRAWETRLGFSSSMAARSIIEAIWETLTIRADPLGQNNAKPLIPETRTRQLTLHCDGAARRVRFSPKMPEFNGIRAVIQNDYRRVRAAVLDGTLVGAARLPADHHRKLLGAWKLKYGIADESVFIPADLPKETAIAPTTTITESFNKADSTTLGPDLVWTELQGNLTIVSNALAQPAQTSYLSTTARADSDLSSADHYAQLKIATKDGVNADYGGPMCRKDSTSALTYYSAWASQKGGAANDQWYTKKYIAGTGTTLAVKAGGPELAVNDVVKLNCDGSTIDRLVNGTSQQSVTDTAIPGNLRCGFDGLRWTSGAVPRWDAFEAADLVAGQTVVVGLASETDTAFGVTIARTLNPGLAAEADTAFAAVAAKTLALGQTLETDTAPAATAAKALAVGQALETDNAFAVTIVRALLAGLALETDTAFAAGMARALALGLALETDTAFALVMASVILVPVIPLAGSTQGAIALVGTSGTIALLGLSRATIPLKGSP